MAENPKTPHYHRVVRRMARALRNRCNLPAGKTVVVACSGGADSVALLRALALLAERRRWGLTLVVAHVQHHLRDAAEDDAAFVEQLAKSLGLAYSRRDIHPGDQPGNVEANARELRYQALSEIAGEHNAQFIATAHHADDQLETLLMRALRGASVSGLRGIAWQKPIHRTVPDAPMLIRPMLAIEQADMADLLHQLDQPWREDATNADTTRTRARLRHEIIPLLKDIQPDAAGKAGDLADHFRDLYDVVQMTADTQMPAPHASDAFKLSRKMARAINPIVLTEVLRRGLIVAGVASDRLTRSALLPAVNAIQDRVGGTRTFRFANDVCIEVTRDAVQLVRP